MCLCKCRDIFGHLNKSLPITIGFKKVSLVKDFTIEIFPKAPQMSSILEDNRANERQYFN